MTFEHIYQCLRIEIDELNELESDQKKFLLSKLKEGDQRIRDFLGYCHGEKKFQESVLRELLGQFLHKQFSTFHPKVITNTGLNSLINESLKDFDVFLDDALGIDIDGVAKLEACFGRHFFLYYLFGTLLTNSIAFIAEFLKRFLNDKTEIRRLFLNNVEPIITKVYPTLADPHYDGKKTLVIEVAGVQKIVYKPRAVNTEELFNLVIQSITEKCEGMNVLPYHIIAKNDYGWVEFIQHQPTKTDFDIEQFYETTGELLALTWLLNCTDINHENIIASGGRPFIIDNEMMLRNGGHEARTILNTLYLPNFILFGGKYTDISGLGSVTSSFNYLNLTEESRHLPIYENERVPPYLYTENIVSGFEFCCRTIFENKSSVIKVIRDYLEGNKLKARHVVYPTRHYVKIFSEIKKSSSLKGFASQISELKKFFPGESSDLLGNELTNLINRNIPVYHSVPLSKELFSNFVSIEDYFDYSGFDIVVEGIDKLDQKAVDVQVNIISKTLLCGQRNLNFLKGQNASVNKVDQRAIDETEINDLISSSLTVQNDKLFVVNIDEADDIYNVVIQEAKLDLLYFLYNSKTQLHLARIVNDCSLVEHRLKHMLALMYIEGVTLTNALINEFKFAIKFIILFEMDLDYNVFERLIHFVITVDSDMIMTKDYLELLDEILRLSFVFSEIKDILNFYRRYMSKTVYLTKE